jgi:hypothetical protein
MSNNINRNYAVGKLSSKEIEPCLNNDTNNRSAQMPKNKNEDIKQIKHGYTANESHLEFHNDTSNTITKNVFIFITLEHL